MVAQNILDLNQSHESAIRLFGKRLLLGAEYKKTNYLGSRNVNYYTEGIEFKPLANLSLYGFYQIRK